jgi:peptidoglycan hydrolase CwlO-like protein
MVVRSLENKTDNILKKSQQLRPKVVDRDQEAKQWKEKIDILKKTVDSMREICSANQSVLGCEVCI